MPVYSILPVNKDDIKETPDRFAIDLQGSEFIFEFMWNPEGEFFSFNLLDDEEAPVVQGRKIVYGQDILENIVDDRLPNLSIYPLDRSGEARQNGITFANFVSQVKLVVVE